MCVCVDTYCDAMVSKLDYQNSVRKFDFQCLILLI